MPVYVLTGRMGTSKNEQSDAELQRESWKPRPGNYYVMKGTWLLDRLTGERGVVADFPEVHEGGTVNILWYPASSEYLSARSFRSRLRNGRFEIDPEQHPYDKVEWGASS